MIIGFITSTEDRISLFIESTCLGYRIDTMERFEIFSDQISGYIVPWTFPDTISGIYCWSTIRCRRTEVGSPCLVTSSHCTGEFLTVCISSSESTEISTISRIYACDEEAHFSTRLDDCGSSIILY